MDYFVVYLNNKIYNQHKTNHIPSFPILTPIRDMKGALSEWRGTPLPKIYG